MPSPDLSSFFRIRRRPPSSTLFPYTTLFRSCCSGTCSKWRRRRTSCAIVPSPKRHCRPTSRRSSKISDAPRDRRDRKSTRLNSSHRCISYAVFCLKKKKTKQKQRLYHHKRER